MPAGACECERDPAGAEFTQAPPAAAACAGLTLTEPANHGSVQLHLKKKRTATHLT